MSEDVRNNRRHSAETLMGDALSAAGVGVWEWNLQDGSVLWSSRVETIFGFEPGTFDGNFDSVAALVHPDDRPLWQDDVEQCLKGVKQHNIQMRITTPQGLVRWVRASGDIERDQARQPVRMMGVLNDITKEKLEYLRSRQLDEKLQRVYNNVPGAILELIKKPDDTGFVEFLNPACFDIWEVTSEQGYELAALMEKLIHPEDVERVLSSLGASAEHQTTWQMEWRVVPEPGRIKWLKSAGSPQKLQGGGTGWTIVSLDITDAKLADQRAEGNLRQTVNVLVRTLEARDPIGDGHALRLAAVAVEIGRQLGFDAHRLRGLELAAILHDIGNILIPPYILNKIGTLSHREMQLVRDHVDLGADLVEGFEFDWPIAEFIRQHHERFDGSGYPRGLQGEDIALEARVILMADAIESMLSNRSATPRNNTEQVLRELQAGAGAQFDPQVVIVCCDLIERGVVQEMIANN